MLAPAKRPCSTPPASLGDGEVFGYLAPPSPSKEAYGLFHGASIDSQSLAAFLLSLKPGEDPVTGEKIPPTRTLGHQERDRHQRGRDESVPA